MKSGCGLIAAKRLRKDLERNESLGFTYPGEVKGALGESRHALERRDRLGTADGRTDVPERLVERGDGRGTPSGGRLNSALSAAGHVAAQVGHGDGHSERGRKAPAGNGAGPVPIKL